MVLLYKYVAPLILDSPEVSLKTYQPTANEPGWLNCSVSSEPESSITWYRMTPVFGLITDNIIRENNSLNYRLT